MDDTAKLVSGITAAAVAFAEHKTNDELNLAASVLMQFADTLYTISTQRDICGKQKIDSENKPKNGG